MAGKIRNRVSFSLFFSLLFISIHVHNSHSTSVSLRENSNDEEKKLEADLQKERDARCFTMITSIGGVSVRAAPAAEVGKLNHGAFVTVTGIFREGESVMGNRTGYRVNGGWIPAQSTTQSCG